MYEICKKAVILVRFKVTLLETKYIACEIVNKRSLNVKNCAFRGPSKTQPSGMSETVVPPTPITLNAPMIQLPLASHVSNYDTLTQYLLGVFLVAAPVRSLTGKQVKGEGVIAK